jgi:UDP-N-acetylglucosamine--N-acetylmuramyl-(pentapeptide) pyrophosphoryl-undecaprenol N-acetylglucosamine transferase
MKLRILLTGGGTGGHIYPLIAVAEKLRKLGLDRGLGLELRYFGDAGDYQFVLESGGIEVSKITSSKMRRYFSLRNFLDFFKFFLGFIQSLWKILWYMPDIAFSKGGPGSLAIVLTCRFYRIPVIIHESDTIPGLTNKISAKFAKEIKISFASTADHFQNIKAGVILTGNPARSDLCSIETGRSRETARMMFGFDLTEPVILILGGSQGAGLINDFILDNIELFIDKFRIIHQLGLQNYQQYKNEFDFIGKELSLSDQKKARYVFRGYLDKDLKDAFMAADLAISRAGAGAIFEIAAFGKPSILIPLPESANDHQRQNAYEYAKTGAALIIEQENLLGNLVVNEIEKILKSPEKLETMSEAAKKFAKPDAAEKIAENIIGLVGD